MKVLEGPITDLPWNIEVDQGFYIDVPVKEVERHRTRICSQATKLKREGKGRFRVASRKEAGRIIVRRIEMYD